MTYRANGPILLLLDGGGNECDGKSLPGTRSRVAPIPEKFEGQKGSGGGHREAKKDRPEVGTLTKMRTAQVSSRMQSGGGMRPPSTLARLHHAAVKAAQAYEAATPGTRKKESKWITWSKLEKKFAEALNDIAPVSDGD